MPFNSDEVRSDQRDRHVLIELNIALPEDSVLVTPLREATRDITKLVDVCDEDAEALMAIVSELASNVVRHAKGDVYQVTLTLFEDEAVITVADNGIGFDPSNVPIPGSVRSDDLSTGSNLRTGGFGLPLVYALSHGLVIEHKQPQGTIVRARRKIRRGELD